MSIVHITTGANYHVTKSYIKFINLNFKSSDHIFLIVDYRNRIPEDIKKNSNTIVIDKEESNYRKNVISYMKNSNKTIFHSLSLDIFLMIYCLITPKLFRRIIWVSWGMDLYQWKKEANNVQYKFRNIIAYKFRKKIRYFVGIFPPDIEFFKKEFESEAKTYYASYTTNLYNPIYKKELKLDNIEEKVKANKCINILIGHSSTRTLNHIDVLNKLKKYRNENIQIHIPLSYGDSRYGDLVQDKAYDLFGSKAICIREMMPENDYMEYLSRIDIAIFNSSRQIGLGNISPLLYMGKKIFMPEGSVMYDFYKSQNISICSYNKIDKMDFADLVEPINTIEGKNYVHSNELNTDKKIEMWSRVFLESFERGE